MRAIARRIYHSMVPARIRFGVRRLLWSDRDLHDPERLKVHLALLDAVTSRNAASVDFDRLLSTVQAIGLLAARAEGDADWQNLAPLFPAQKLLFVGEPGWDESEVYFVVGIGQRYSEELALVHASGRPCFVLEEPFLKNVVPIGLHWMPDIPRRCFRSVAYLFDARGPAFHYGIPTQLEHDLNSSLEPSLSELSRSNALMSRIVAERISKYNCQPISEVLLPPATRRRVLLVDQTYRDYSVTLSGGDDRAFALMLQRAIDENPGAEVLVKMHVEHAGRETYLGRLQIPAGVTVLSRPANPICLLNAVDKVYTYSSTMGWEALMCGKEVHVFGTPIYAGWGLTHDRHDLSARRNRTRTLAELFYFIYLRASRYIDPATGARCSIDRALDYLVESREAFLRQFPGGPPAGAS